MVLDILPPKLMSLSVHIKHQMLENIRQRITNEQMQHKQTTGTAAWLQHNFSALEPTHIPCRSMILEHINTMGDFTF